MSLTKFKKLQDEFNEQIDVLLKEYIRFNKVIEKVKYSMNGGKRLRPIIALDICRSISMDSRTSGFRPTSSDCDNNYENKGVLMAFGIELIHTASIILDDMPCMDNDYYRRGQPSFHVKYGLREAQVASNLLMALACKVFYKNFNGDKSKLIIANNIISNNLGFNGVAYGQYLDLDLSKININMFDNKDEVKKKLDKNTLKELLNKKTTTLFEIAFIGGYLSGVDDSSKLNDTTVLNKIKRASEHFGLAFQIYDDFDDIEQDKKKDEMNLFDSNYVNNLGLNEAYKDFTKHIFNFRQIMTTIGLYTEILDELTTYLTSKVEDRIKNMSNE